MTSTTNSPVHFKKNSALEQARDTQDRVDNLMAAATTARSLDDLRDHVEMAFNKGQAAEKKPRAKKEGAVKAPRGAAPGVPAKERRAALVRLLRQSKATTEGSAKPISVLAAKLGYTNYDVYCLAYHKYPLAVGGFVQTIKTEDNPKELSVYLTPLGKSCKIEELP